MAGPLSDLHIVDLSTYVAGPSAALALAQLGADVVRIDPLGGATDTRRLPLAPDGTSLYWAGLNRYKRSVEVDLRTAQGRDLVRSLLACGGDGHGILITNAVGQSWLDYEDLRRSRPDLIMIHIAGRVDGKPAVDYTVNAEVGLPWLTGPSDSSAPVNHVLPAWDLLTGLHASLALVTADRERRRSGNGQYIRINLSDVAVTTMAHLGFIADAAVNGSQRLREGNYLYGSYGSDFATRDGRRVMVVALTARHWAKLVQLTGVGDVITALEHSLRVDFSQEQVRYEHRDVITALLTPWFAARAHADVVRELDDGQVLWGDYRRVDELGRHGDSPVSTSGLFVDVDQPGAGRYPVPRSALRTSGWEGPTPRPPARVGQDTADILQEWLQMPREKLVELQHAGVIAGASPRREGQLT
ncbi:2-methylfumaryl-CoA isomerase [Geodermatophilus sabuli]|uniref:2-methylfumaryl-CoA isomerase n=1 Tax=Geodermatophilus sabuli TaxID=1564158 RepID=A0A7K3VXP0_9ACTN|nr:2-methylfumaryl-CoA isomerase [Geodermatophilus sabuli]